jgi:hypothetical protein
MSEQVGCPRHRGPPLRIDETDKVMAKIKQARMVRFVKRGNGPITNLLLTSLFVGLKVLTGGSNLPSAHARNGSVD